MQGWMSEGCPDTCEGWPAGCSCVKSKPDPLYTNRVASSLLSTRPGCAAARMCQGGPGGARSRAETASGDVKVQEIGVEPFGGPRRAVSLSRLVRAAIFLARLVVHPHLEVSLIFLAAQRERSVIQLLVAEVQGAHVAVAAGLPDRSGMRSITPGRADLMHRLSWFQISQPLQSSTLLRHPAPPPGRVLRLPGCHRP